MIREKTGSGARILVLEDDDAQREVLVTLLTRHGYRVDSAASVEQASRLLERSRYDVMIADYELPDGTVLDVHHHAAATIILSGTTGKHLPPGSQFLPKPVNLDRLLRLIARVHPAGG